MDTTEKLELIGKVMLHINFSRLVNTLSSTLTGPLKSGMLSHAQVSTHTQKNLEV